jgi:hypothetical protein
MTTTVGTELDAEIREMLAELSRATSHVMLAHRRLIAGDEADAIAELNRAIRIIRDATVEDYGAPFRIVTETQDKLPEFSRIEDAWAAAIRWGEEHPGRAYYVANADGRPIGRPEDV